MLRDKLIERHSTRAPHEFRWRSREISRLEGLSDAVFGFAVTLLIVALEVPRTSGELLETMRGFASFALTFTFLYLLWYRQFVFFRRYGLEDRTTAILNGALLFVVLFFVFPLKFLFSTLVNRLLGGGGMVRLPNGTMERAIQPQHLTAMMTIYGLGSAAVFALFALLYLHAYHRRRELRLTELERLDTLQGLYAYVASAGIGLLTVLYASAANLYRGTPYEDKAVLVTTVVYLAALALILKRRVQRKRQRQKIVERLIAEGALPQGDPEEH
ncbi:MAG TPA: TMEM175 family protein [Thermoanaerobaculia bacterium]|nr:TMEM175 family protein [Thermoanaerobaculia bacterium]